MDPIQSSILDFLRFCRYEKNLSDKTLKAYTIDLKQFTSFLDNKYSVHFITDVSKTEIRGFLEYLSSMKPKTIKRKIATLKAMFNFLEFEDRISVNPMRKTRINIREPKVLPKAMSLQEITSILNGAYLDINAVQSKESFAYFEKLRNLVILELLFTTGARVSEIAELKTRQLNLKSGMITIKGKGNKERIVQICSDGTMNVLVKYFVLAQEKIKHAGDAFFINRLGRRLSDQSVRLIVKKYSSLAQISRRITPHSFRHSFATLLLENDVDIKYIQTLLGHSSVTTTQIYTHVNSVKQKEILASKHPRMGKSFQSMVVRE